jgi:hypothetical protein
MTDSMAASLAKIMGDVGRIEKKGQITSQGSGPTYKFARDSDVLEKVGPMMAEAGIVMVPEHQELLSVTPSLSGKQLIANIKTGWLVTDGKESIRFETFGQGADSGDKALPKAQSNSRKYAFFMLYHIVTGDDPDQHASDEPTRRPRPRPAQPDGALRDAVTRAAAEHGFSRARMEAIQDEVGIPRGERATAEQLRAVLALIEQPVREPVGGEEAEVRSAPPGLGSSASALLEQPPQGSEVAQAEADVDSHPPAPEPAAVDPDYIASKTGGTVIPSKTVEAIERAERKGKAQKPEPLTAGLVPE